jgi:deoxyribodipyrimidine photo-lyase
MSGASQRPNAIVWFRRDLRTQDHPPLNAAIEHAKGSGGAVIAAFVVDSQLLGPSGSNRAYFLFEAIRSMQRDGVPVQLLAGNPAEVLAGLAVEHNAQIFAAGDCGPYGRTRDAEVAAEAAKYQVGVSFIDTPYLVAPGTVRKGDGTPYKVFTPFSRAWLGHAQHQRPVSAPDLGAVRWGTLTNTTDIPVYVKTANTLPQPSEKAAHAAASVFLSNRIDAYDVTRDDPGLDATSRLGAYLKFGLLHPRQLLERVESSVTAGSEGARIFRTELAWREFYADVLWHRPESARWNNVEGMDIETDSGPTADVRFAAWCEGRTGYPFIDAGMRQLLSEGWMHNRVRMATASFLVKDLHLDWQRGAAWFMRHLVDGDLASNQHGWQWTAGTGTDAAPYFRIFNPISQGKRFDPDGVYVKRWVPELGDVAKKFIHEPWLEKAAPRQLGLGSSVESISKALYPAPIVDHGVERDEAMARYRATRPAK